MIETEKIELRFPISHIHVVKCVICKNNFQLKGMYYFYGRNRKTGAFIGYVCYGCGENEENREYVVFS